MLSDIIRYGAVATKVRALYGRRLKAQDYAQMMSLTGVPQVASVLKNHPSWSVALADLSEETARRGQIEARLQSAYFDEYNRIGYHIHMKDKKRYEMVLMRTEIRQIMLFLRNLSAGRVQDYVPLLPQEIIAKLSIDISILRNAKNMDDLLQSAQNSLFYGVLQRFAQQDTMDVSRIETALETHYYQTLLSYIQKTYSKAAQKHLVRQVGEFVDLENIQRTLRLRRFSQLASSLPEMLIDVHYRLDNNFFAQLLTVDDEKIHPMLMQSPYEKVFANSHFQISQAIDDYLHDDCHKLLFSGRPGIFIPMAYLTLKEIEMHNVIHIIESVRYGLPPAQIQTFLVGAATP